jgi:hypothetical protein
LSDALRQQGATRPRIRRRLGQVREPDLGRASPGERRFADQALVEDAPERVDVAGARGLPSLDQLGREVMGRPEQLALRGQPRRVRPAREPEVRERRSALAVEEDVRRLDVPVQDPARVKSVEAAAELGSEIDGLLQRERPEQPQPQRERAAGVVRHREVGDVP